MPERLTVIIPCKNERKNIRPCIESVRGIADEVLVADSGSTDGTLDIVQSMGGCRIIEREYVHSGDFKNWAIPQARHEWVLILDADERVTPAMAREIRTLLDADSARGEGPACDGYWVYRHNYFMGHLVRHGDWGHDSVLRLFRRDRGRYVGDTDHAEVEVTGGKVGELKNRLEHYTYWSYAQYFDKFQRYTGWQARVWKQQGRKPSLFKLLLNGPFRFLRAYIVQLGFLDGIVGFQLAMLTGFYSFAKQARLWQEWYGRPQLDPEAKAEISVSSARESSRAERSAA